MGDCTYCGKAAGFLRHKHKECEEAHLAGRNQIATAIDEAFSSEAFLSHFLNSLATVQNPHSSISPNSESF